MMSCRSDGAPKHWTPDTEAVACYVCRRPFSVMNRKHHCRKCGAVICDSCSKTRISVPEQGIASAVRVCDDCMQQNGADNIGPEEVFEGIRMLREAHAPNGSWSSNEIKPSFSAKAPQNKVVQTVPSLGEAQACGLSISLLCDGCDCELGVVQTVRYWCADCRDFELCESCFVTVDHPHPRFIKWDGKTKGGTNSLLQCRTPMCAVGTGGTAPPSRKSNDDRRCAAVREGRKCGCSPAPGALRPDRLCTSRKNSFGDGKKDRGCCRASTPSHNGNDRTCFRRGSATTPEAHVDASGRMCWGRQSAAADLSDDNGSVKSSASCLSRRSTDAGEDTPAESKGWLGGWRKSRAADEGDHKPSRGCHIPFRGNQADGQANGHTNGRAHGPTQGPSNGATNGTDNPSFVRTCLPASRDAAVNGAKGVVSGVASVTGAKNLGESVRGCVPSKSANQAATDTWDDAPASRRWWKDEEKSRDPPAGRSWAVNCKTGRV